MNIQAIQPLSALDYPGHLSAIIFLGGCNFNCPFCHNKELINPNSSLLTIEDVIEFLAERKDFLDSVCISGGEPLFQNNLVELLKKIKGLGYLIKLDTNGTNFAALKEIIEAGLVDYVAMDIKSSLDKYSKASGIRLDNLQGIKSSANFLMHGTVDYEFRTTVADGLHQEADFNSIAQWLCGAKRYYLQRFKPIPNCIALKRPSETTMQKYQNILQDKMLFVGIR